MTAYVGGWRLGCSLVAVLTALATVAAGVHKHSRTSEHLGTALSCVAELSGLQFSLAVLGSSGKDVAQQYKAVLEKYALYMT